MPKLIMLGGPSGSGKSKLAREMMQADGNLIRINRDSIRAMSIPKWTPAREKWIIEAEKALARAAANLSKNILIDDTNLLQKHEDMWKNVAKEIGYNFEKKILKVPLLTCVERDSQRFGAERIGRAAIERQFLRAKLNEWPSDRQYVIFDLDGTMADLSHRTAWITPGSTCPRCKSFASVNNMDFLQATWNCPYCENGILKKKYHDIFYAQVNLDPPIEIVVKWAQECAKHFYVLIVSGRSPETSEDGTIAWLKNHNVHFDHIYMRRAYHHGPDTEEKQLILNDLLESGLKKEQIEFIVDDRPCVVKMWKENGLRVIPVRGRDDDKFYELMDHIEVNHGFQS